MSGEAIYSTPAVREPSTQENRSYASCTNGDLAERAWCLPYSPFSGYRSCVGKGEEQKPPSPCLQGPTLGRGVAGRCAHFPPQSGYLFRRRDRQDAIVRRNKTSLFNIHINGGQRGLDQWTRQPRPLRPLTDRRFIGGQPCGQ